MEYKNYKFEDFVRETGLNAVSTTMKENKNYKFEDLVRETGLNAVLTTMKENMNISVKEVTIESDRLLDFKNISYALPCSPKTKVKRVRKFDKEWKTRVESLSLYNLCEFSCIRNCNYGNKCLDKLSVKAILKHQKDFWNETLIKAPTQTERRAKMKKL